MKRVLGLLVVLGLAISPLSHAGKLYRFHIDGRIQIKDHVPPAYSHLGYEILNEQGIVLRKVAPAPTAAELAERRAKEEAARIRKEQIVMRRKADNDLLRLYAKPADVERARSRKADEIESYIQLQRRRIADLDIKLEAEQGAAANMERSGREVPANMRLAIVQLQNRIRDSHANIATRQQELIDITQQYAAQYERVRILQVYKPGTLDDQVDLDRVDKLLDTSAAP